jgi:hypothetical protein
LGTYIALKKDIVMHMFHENDLGMHHDFGTHSVARHVSKAARDLLSYDLLLSKMIF